MAIGSLPAPLVAGVLPTVVFGGVRRSATRCASAPGSATPRPVSRFDVPARTAANLHVDQRHLAIGGFSFGGTCALQLAVRRPDAYPSFLDISGQSEPTLDDRQQTVAAAFGGDEEAFRRVNPLDEMQRATFPEHRRDHRRRGSTTRCTGPDAEKVAAAARAAGMTIALTELNGARSWTVATQARSGALPWISGRTGLLQP